MGTILNKSVLFIFKLFNNTSVMAENLRSPKHFFFGYIAKKVMVMGNQRVIEDSVRRLNVREADTVLEIGSGNGQAIIEILKKEPKEIKVIEVSSIFRKILERQFQNKIEILDNDAKDLKGIINTNSIDKLLLINVVYFLDPLESYLKEFRRILKKDGIVLIAGKFDAVRNFDDKIFKNKDIETLLKTLNKYFSVDSYNIQITGRK